jgi:hypothetical protein
LADVLRIKRRAAAGAAGPPSALANAEVCYNERDDTLYYGKGGTAGAAATILAIGGPGAYQRAITISDTAPSSPVVGTLWFDSVNTQTYMWYSDPNSSQWVPLNTTPNTNTGSFAAVVEFDFVGIINDLSARIAALEDQIRNRP